jgi:hypothetical protein
MYMYDARMLLSRHAYTYICFDVRSMSGSHASYYITLLIIFNYQGRLGDNAVHETEKLSALVVMTSKRYTA